MKKFILFLMILCCLELQGQNVQLVTSYDVPEATITRNDSFSGEGLYGYIDGGADLVFEYGFKAVFVSDYRLGNLRAQLEVYEMNDASAAFGLYSLSVGNCREWNRFGTFSCSTPYQVAAASGPLFISATNRMGSRDGQALCELLVKKMLEKNPQATWRIPPLFQHQKLAPFISTLRMFRGPLAVATALPAWEDLFDNIEFRMFTLTIMTQEITGTLARIEFKDESARSSFMSRSGVNTLDYSSKPVRTGNGLYRSWYEINRTTIIFLESNTESRTIKELIPEIPNTIPDQRW